MNFAKMPATASVFVDANTFIYHFQPHPFSASACSDFLKRCELKDLSGFTSTHVLGEVAHRLMMFEATVLFGGQAKIVQRRKQHPAEVQKLTKFRLAVEKIPQLGIQVLTIPAPLIATAAAISQQTGIDEPGQP